MRDAQCLIATFLRHTANLKSFEGDFKLAGDAAKDETACRPTTTGDGPTIRPRALSLLQREQTS